MEEGPVGCSASWRKGQLGLVPVGFVGGSNLTSFSALDDLRMMIEIFSSIIGFTPSVLDSEKMSRELLTPRMTPS